MRRLFEGGVYCKPCNNCEFIVPFKRQFNQYNQPQKTKNKSYMSFQFIWLYMKIELSTDFYIMARLVSFRLSFYFNVTVSFVVRINAAMSRKIAAFIRIITVVAFATVSVAISSAGKYET